MMDPNTRALRSIILEEARANYVATIRLRHISTAEIAVNEMKITECETMIREINEA